MQKHHNITAAMCQLLQLRFRTKITETAFENNPIKSEDNGSYNKLHVG